MAAWQPLISLILFAVIFMGVSRAGTRMLEPPTRASLWRYGYNTPRNPYDDKTDCGGYEKQYIKNGGDCGVCGDPSDEPTPRRHEAGGEFSPNPTPVRAFEMGSYVTVVMETSSSLFGKFEFRLCNISHNMETPGQSCFDQNLLTILESEEGTEYQIGSRQGIHVLNVQLPAGLVCRHCILQWAHKTGFTTNPDTCLTCPGGESKCYACKGCGNQVWHVGCTDITIYETFQSSPVASTSTSPPGITTQPPPASTPTTLSRSATPSPSGCSCPPHPDPNDNLINSPTSYTGHFSGSTRSPDTANVSINSNNGAMHLVNNTSLINSNTKYNTTNGDVVYSTGNYNIGAVNGSKMNVSIQKTREDDRGSTMEELLQKYTNGVRYPPTSYPREATAPSEWRNSTTIPGFDVPTGETWVEEGNRTTQRPKQKGGLLKGGHSSGVSGRDFTQTTLQHRVVTSSSSSSSPDRRSNTNTTPHFTIVQSKSPHMAPSQTSTPHTILPQRSTPHTIISNSSTPQATTSQSNTTHTIKSQSSARHTTASPYDNTHINNQHTTKSLQRTLTTQISTSFSSPTYTQTTTNNIPTRPVHPHRNEVFCYITNRTRNPRRNFDLWCSRNCPNKGIFTCLYHTCSLALCSRDNPTGNSLAIGNSEFGFPQGIYRKQDTINKHGSSFLSGGGDYFGDLNRDIIDISSRYLTSEERSQRSGEVYRHQQQLIHHHHQKQQQQQQQQQRPPIPSLRTEHNFHSPYSPQNIIKPYIRNNNNNNRNLMSLLPFLFREGFEF